MAFKVQVGPHQVSIHQGQTVLVSEPDGQINWPSEKGVYFLDTRVISSWAIYANGEPWDLLNGGAISYYASRIYLTNRNIPTGQGIIPLRTLGLIISRCFTTAAGSLRWIIRLDANSLPDITITTRMAPDNQVPLDYYLLPSLDMTLSQLRLREENGVTMDVYRFDDLTYFCQLTRRSRIQEAA